MEENKIKNVLARKLLGCLLIFVFAAGVITIAAIAVIWFLNRIDSSNSVNGVFYLSQPVASYSVEQPKKLVFDYNSGRVVNAGKFAINIDNVEYNEKTSRLTLSINIENTGNRAAYFSSVLFVNILSDAGIVYPQDFDLYDEDLELSVDRRVESGDSISGELYYVVDFLPESLSVRINQDILNSTKFEEIQIGWRVE
jgi:hypothetical protein